MASQDTPVPQDRQFAFQDVPAMQAAVYEIVYATPVTDIHTHLYAPAFGELLLWGIDETLTYHYLIAEFFRASDLSYDQFWAMDKQDQADAIWDALFLKQSPFSEGCRGPITILHRLGLNVASRDLGAYRAWFAARNGPDYVEEVFRVANLRHAIMTNDPFDPLERPVWDSGFAGDPRFPAALRIDPLLNDWGSAYGQLSAWGYGVGAELTDATLSEVRRFLSDWVTRMEAKYMAVSLPPDFAFPEATPRALLIEECVLPVARFFNIPFAMMIGVTRKVNPALRLAGDGVGTASLAPVERLCAGFPQNKFMVTFLSRENTHSACVAARKFRNLLPFGCWWFLNDPSLIEEMTRMRFELLGPSVIPQHSDARILDQVIYKWDHSRMIIAKVLADKYEDLLRSGWIIRECEIRRDAEGLLGGIFWRFLDRKL